MSFTDEELRELKLSEDYDEEIGYKSRCEYMKRLITRLEAAERVIHIMGSDPLSGKVGNAYEAWRKSAGKEVKG